MNSRPFDVAFGPDRDEAIAMQRDSVVVRYFSMRMLLAQKRVMDRLPENVGALTAPVLILEGAHDALIDPAGNNELLARAAVTGSTKVVAPDGGHGSSAVETTVESLVGWLEARLVTPSHVNAANGPGEAERRRP
jgi:pimeloyl-ACP methyl ester carboxylesterase